MPGRLSTRFSYTILTMHHCRYNHARICRKPIGPVLVSLMLIAFSTMLHAQESNSDINEKPDGIPVPIPNVTASIDSAHENASLMLNKFASQLDNFFGEEDDENIVNESRATLRTDLVDPADGSFSTTAKLKVRLVLPRSQERLRFLLDVDERDDQDSPPTLPEEDLNRDFSFALRFIRNTTERTRFNIDLGARRFDSRFQSFARLRLSTRFRNEEGWSFEFKNDLRQYYSSGYTNRMGLNFWHTLNNDPTMIFRTATNFNWENIQNGARVDQSVGIYKELRHNSLLAFEFLAGYNTRPENDNRHYEGHTVRIRYRKNTFRPWFHYELWPSISWLTENNSQPTFGGLVRFEVQLGEYR